MEFVLFPDHFCIHHSIDNTSTKTSLLRVLYIYHIVCIYLRSISKVLTTKLLLVLTAPIVSLSKIRYPHRLVMVSSRNRVNREFIIELK